MKTMNGNYSPVCLQCIMFLDIFLVGGSCTAEVEFEFTTRVAPKATADFHFCGGGSSFFLFVCLCMQVSGRKKATAGMAIGSGDHCQSLFQWWLPLPIAVSVVVLNSSSSCELKLYLSWKKHSGRYFVIESDHRSLEQISMKNMADVQYIYRGCY